MIRDPFALVGGGGVQLQIGYCKTIATPQNNLNKKYKNLIILQCNGKLEVLKSVSKSWEFLNRSQQ